jgi:hypothetical protein
MKNYENNGKKFVVILNAKAEIPILMNAVGHIAAGIGTCDGNKKEMDFLQYADADGTFHPAISKYPLIVLKAKNSDQIRRVRLFAIANGVTYNDFTDTMLGFSADDQLEKTRNRKEIDLEYHAIILFGEAELLDKETRRFSLFK